MKSIEKYFQDGFIIVPKLFTQDELDLAIQTINECVDNLAEKLYRGGKIKDKAVKAGFYERLTLLENQFPGTAVLLHKLGNLPVGFRGLWSNEKLLNIIEQFVGPEIAAHPVWNLRPKSPMNDQTMVPWHQDNAYFFESALHTLIATAWIPLIDANVTNGCIQVVRGGHRVGRTATHTCCAGDTWHVDLAEDEIEKTLEVDMKKDVVTCEVPLGGVLFINNGIPHRSLENYSDKIRWSLDLRWQKPDSPSGFEGMKDCLLLRTAKDPNYRVDWEGFATADRTVLQKEIVGIDDDDEFDTTIHGQWMSRWEITHHNRHTEALRKSKNLL